MRWLVAVLCVGGMPPPWSKSSTFGGLLVFVALSVVIVVEEVEVE